TQISNYFLSPPQLLYMTHACPEAPSDRTTVRICHTRTQKKPDFSRAFLVSGWQDSNLRPPHPKCGAIPGYATPRLGITFIVAQIYNLYNYMQSLFFTYFNNILIICEII